MITLLCAVIASGLIASHLSAESIPIIPLQQGDEWIYTADVSWTVPESNLVKSASIVWRMRIVKKLAGADRTVAIVRGFLTDLEWYQPETEPGYSVLVQTESGFFMSDALNEQHAEDVAKKAIAGQPIGEQLLGIPVHVGSCLGDPKRNRDDHEYCWFVKEQVPERQGEAFVLSYYTNPDETAFHIVPGIGIVQFHFRHHGTVASADARLIKFEPASHH